MCREDEEEEKGQHALLTSEFGTLNNWFVQIVFNFCIMPSSAKCRGNTNFFYKRKFKKSKTKYATRSNLGHVAIPLKFMKLMVIS